MDEELVDFALENQPHPAHQVCTQTLIQTSKIAV